MTQCNRLFVVGRCQKSATNFWQWKDREPKHYKRIPSKYAGMTEFAFCNEHAPGSSKGCIKPGFLKPMDEDLHAAYRVVEE